MERLDEAIKEEADGIHNSLGELLFLCALWMDSVLDLLSTRPAFAVY